MSKATEDMSKKVESNKRAIVSSNRKQERLQVARGFGTFSIFLLTSSAEAGSDA